MASPKPPKYFAFAPPKNLDNDQPYFLYGVPMITAGLAGVATWSASMVGLWHLAGATGWLGGTSNMGLLEHSKYWFEGMADLWLRHKHPFAADVAAYQNALDLMPWMLVKGKALISAIPAAGVARWVVRKLTKRHVYEEQVGGVQFITGPTALPEAVKAVDKLNGRTETDRHRWWRERGLPLSVKGLGRKGLLTIHPLLPDFCERALSRSMLILGSAGAGKTAMFAHVFYSAMRGKQFLVVLDVKGDLTYVFQQMAKRMKHGKNRVAVISMFCDTDHGWDLGRDHRYAADADQHAERWVLAGDGNPIWHQGGRLGFAVIELSLINEYNAALKKHALRMAAWEARKEQARLAGTPFTEKALRAPVPWHAGHLAFRLSTYDLPKIVELAKAYDPIAAQVYKNYDTNTAVQSFETTFRVFSKPLVNIGNAWGDAAPGQKPRKRISLLDFVNGMGDKNYKGPRVLILRSNERYKEMSRGYITAMHAFLTEAVLALPDNPSDGTGRNLTVFLDEFAALGKGIKDSIESALARGRSKGYKHIIATQTEAAMIELFGENGLKSILGNLGLRIIGMAANNQDASEIAATFGTKKMRVKRPDDDEPTFRDEPVLESNFLSSSDNMGPQSNGVKALLPLGDKLFHLEWPFASSDKVPRAPSDKAPYELASWMTGGETAPLSDYNPWPDGDPDEQEPEEPEEPTEPPPPESDGVSGGPSIVVTTVGNPDKKGISIDPDKAARLREALARNPLARTRTETATIEAEAQAGSPEYEQAVIQAVEDQRAAEQNGDWIDPGEEDEGNSMLLKVATDAALDAVVPGAKFVLDALEVAEGLQGPMQKIETRIDSVGDVRTVAVTPPTVTQEFVVPEKTPRQMQEEQDRERDRILRMRPGVAFRPGQGLER